MGKGKSKEAGKRHLRIASEKLAFPTSQNTMREIPRTYAGDSHWIDLGASVKFAAESEEDIGSRDETRESRALLGK